MTHVPWDIRQPYFSALMSLREALVAEANAVQPGENITVGLNLKILEVQRLRQEYIDYYYRSDREFNQDAEAVAT